AGKSATRIRSSDELAAAHPRRGPQRPTYLQEIAPLSHRSALANHVAPPEKNLANKARLELCVSPLASLSAF
ncbi:MAG: hypothetical protein WCP35_21120, partial [Verrucomicrobiota bacterium]